MERGSPARVARGHAVSSLTTVRTTRLHRNTREARVHAVSSLTTVSPTCLHRTRSEVFGSSAPGSSPASHSTWKPLQMPSKKKTNRGGGNGANGEGGIDARA